MPASIAGVTRSIGLRLMDGRVLTPDDREGAPFAVGKLCAVFVT